MDCSGSGLTYPIRSTLMNWEVTKWEVDKVGKDEVKLKKRELKKVGIDQLGMNPIYKLQLSCMGRKTMNGAVSR